VLLRRLSQKVLTVLLLLLVLQWRLSSQVLLLVLLVLQRWSSQV
jgi:hypothetical protein